MQIHFEEFDGRHLERLAPWMAAQHWPFHAPSKVDETWVRERDSSGYFCGPDTKTFWIYGEGTSTLGIVRAFDLADVTPLIDLRLAGAHRGKRVGTVALCWITDFVFEAFPDKHRLGGYTRHDNLAMRRVFDKCRFVQEAHHRQAWRIDHGAFADAVGYAMLRDDWFTADALRGLPTLPPR